MAVRFSLIRAGYEDSSRETEILDKRRPILVAVSTIVVAMLLVACARSEDAPLVFVAASLVDVMEEIATEYRQETGQTVRFNFGGSNLLAHQIVAGAPANAVIVSGKTPIDLLVADGEAASEDIVQVFSNRLVVVRPKGSEMADLELSEMVGAERIAMPDPASAPAGEYFEVALKDYGLWESLQAQIVPTLDVRAALSAAASGNVAYAFVYETDAISSDDVEIAFAIDDASEFAVPRYYASSLHGDDKAGSFIAFLMSEEAMSILKKHGFRP